MKVNQNIKKDQQQLQRMVNMYGQEDVVKYINENFDNSFDEDETDYADAMSVSDHDDMWRTIYKMVNDFCDGRLYIGYSMHDLLTVGDGDYFDEPIYPFIPGVLSINHKDGGEASCYPVELIPLVLGKGRKVNENNPISVEYWKFLMGDYESQFDAGEAWMEFLDKIINTPLYKITVECITTYALVHHHYDMDLGKGSQIPGWSPDLAKAEISKAMDNAIKFKV